MIIRILSEGQYDVPAAEVDALNVLDDQLEQAIAAGDEETFAAALAQILDRVRTAGTVVAPDALIPSDLLLPFPEASINEVRDLLSGDGLIPG